MAQNKTLNARISWKRDTSANWTSNDPVLLNGEIIIVDTAGGETRFKIGDGTKRYSQLPFEDEAIRNLIGEKAKVSIETWANADSSVSIPLDELVINKVANSTVYQAMKDAGKIDDNELYLVEGDGMEILPTLTSGTKIADIMIDGVATASLYAPSLSAYATKVSPEFTGTPKAPTAAANDNSTQIATTAYADRAATNAANSLKNTLTSGTTTIIVKEAEHAANADNATTATTASGLNATGIAQVQDIKVNSAAAADTATSADKTTGTLTVQGNGTGITFNGSANKTVNIKGAGSVSVSGATTGVITITGATIPTSLKNPNALTVGSKTYDGSSAITILPSDLGLESALKFVGTTTTVLTDGATTSPIVINSANHTPSQGDVVIVNGTDQEFLWTGSAWEILGDASSHSIKGHTHQVTHKPAGTVSQPTFTGTAGTATATYTPAGTVSKPTFSGTQATINSSYTPAGTVSAPEFTGDEATITVTFKPEGTVSQPTFTGSAVNSGAATTSSGHTQTVYSITGVGTLPSASLSAGTLPSASVSGGGVTLSGSVSSRHLTITATHTNPTVSISATYPTLTWDAGTLPTRSSALTVPTTSHKHSVTATGSISQPTFTGTEDSASSTYVPTGSVSAPTFTGTAGTATATYKPAGSVTQPTFTGTEATINSSYTPAGTVSKPTFSGTEATLTTTGSSN